MYEKNFEVGENRFDKRDFLSRADSAKRLSSFLDGATRPVVVALEGGWGTGKTFFLKTWVGERQAAETHSKTVYIDAFAHDYLDDPLIALVHALDVVLEDQKDPIKSSLCKLKAAGKVIAAPAIRVAAAYLSSGATEVVAAAASELSGGAKEYLDGYWKVGESRISAVEEFKKALQDIAKEERIVFVVDELDRCRPDFALALLEIAKHFFSVPNVHFVLGANWQQLEASVSSQYGALIDGYQYLQKFINVRFRLPDPKRSISVAVYCDRRTQELADEYPEFKSRQTLLDSLNSSLEIENIQRKISLRGVELALTRISMLPEFFGRDNWFLRELAIALVLLEVMDSKLFEAVLRGDVREGSGALDVLNDSRQADSQHYIIEMAVRLYLGIEARDQLSQSLDKIYFAHGGWPRMRPTIKRWLQDAFANLSPSEA